MPRRPDMVILVLTESRQNRLHYTPCTCAPGNKYMHTDFLCLLANTATCTCTCIIITVTVSSYYD